MFRCAAAMTVILAAGSATALAQDPTPVTATTTTSAQDLLKALQEAGVDVSSVATVNEDGTVTVRVPQAPSAAGEAADIEAEAGADVDLPPTAEAKEEKAVKWDNKFTLGFGLSEGNTENANVTSIYVLTRESERMKTVFDAAYFYATDSGEESENRFSTGILNDWLFPGSRWLFFADARYDYDEFQSWRHRFAFHVGPGYKLIDEDDLKLTLRAGAGALKEWLSDNDNWRPEGLAGFDFEWNISERQSFVTNFRIYPDLDDFGEFRSTTLSGWKLDIDQADGLALTLGLLWEYQSVVDAGNEHNDLKIFGGLTFDF